MDPEAMRDYELSERAALEAERREDEANFDEDEPEPSEEEIATKGLDEDAMDDFMAIRRAVMHSKISERLVDVAVKSGLKERT